MTFELETPRLILREMTMDDLEPMLEVLGDPVSMRFYPRLFNREHTVAWIERMLGSYKEHGFGLWAVVLKSSGDVIGDCGIMLQHPLGEPELEIGWHIHPLHQRTGYATEAGIACRDWGFDNTDRPQLISMIRPENEPSRGVAMKLGMMPGVQFDYKGTNHELWAIDRDEWAALKERPAFP